MTFDTTTDYSSEVEGTRSPWNLARAPGIVWRFGSRGGSGHRAAFHVVGWWQIDAHPGVILRLGRAEGLAQEILHHRIGRGDARAPGERRPRILGAALQSGAEVLQEDRHAI